MQVGLDEQDVAAGRRPGQAGGDAGLCDAFAALSARKRVRPEKFCEIFRR